MDTFLVKNKDGRTAKVAWDNVYAAEKDGYYPVVKKGNKEARVKVDNLAKARMDGFEALSHKPIKELPYTKAESMGRGGLQGGSLGFADEGAGVFWGVGDVLTGKASPKDIVDRYYFHRNKSREKNVQAQADNPGSYLGGELAGGVGSAFVPGLGVLNAAKGARLAQVAGRGALSGGLYGAGQAKELENVPGEIATQAAIGGVSGPAFQKLGETVVKGAKAVPGALKKEAEERAVKAVTGQNIKAIRDMAKTTHASAGDVSKFEKNIGRVGRELLEETTPEGKPVIGAFDNVEGIAPKLAEARKGYGEKIGEVSKTIDAFFPNGAVKGQKIASELREYANKIPPIDTGVGLRKRINTIANQMDSVGDLTFKDANLFKNQFKFKATDQDLVMGNKDVTNKIRSIIGNEMDNTANDLSKKLGQFKEAPIKSVNQNPSVRDPFEIGADDYQKIQTLKSTLDKYKHFKDKYGTFKGATDAATDRVQKNLSNRFISPSDYGAGAAVSAGGLAATGDPTMLLFGLAASGANKLARERGSAGAARVLIKLSELAKNPSFSNKYTQYFAKQAEGGPGALMATHAMLTQTDPVYRKYFEGN
jgi:hypothetical protein